MRSERVKLPLRGLVITFSYPFIEYEHAKDGNNDFMPVYVQDEAIVIFILFVIFPLVLV